MALRSLSFATLAAAALVAAASCSSAELEGTNWACRSDGDCLDGKRCSKAVQVSGTQAVEILPSPRRCMAPAQANIVLGVAGLMAETTWRPGVEACVKQINEANGIEGVNLSLNWQEFDILSGGVGQLDNFQALTDTAQDPAAPPGPKSVDALFGFIGELSPLVVAPVREKNLLLFGAADGNPDFRTGSDQNLFFWRPSLKDEMDAVAGLIINPGLMGAARFDDPKKVYVTRWPSYFDSALPAFANAWNERANTTFAGQAKLANLDPADNFGFYYVEENPATPSPGANYGDFVTNQFIAEFTNFDQHAKDFLDLTGRRAIVILDGPAGAAGFLAALTNYVGQPGNEQKLNDVDVYIYSNSIAILPTVISTAIIQYPGVDALSLIGPALRKAKGTSVVPNPRDTERNALAATYQKDVTDPNAQSLLGFEAYLSCLSFSDVLRKSMRDFRSVDNESLLRVLRGERGPVLSPSGGANKSIQPGQNYVGPPTIYIFDFPTGDIFNPTQTSRWENGALKN